ncbi:MAG: VOC family protein [Balneolaceae bacterium]
MKNVISWFEIPVSDIQRARKFYEAIFGFEMHAMELGDGPKMMIFPAEEGTVGGALIQFSEWYNPSNSKGPLLYLNANPDLEEVLSRVEDAGGEVIIAKRQISSEFGYMGVFIDCEGNRIALHSDQ